MDNSGFREGSAAGELRAAAPAELVWSTRLQGDRLRDLRASSLPGTDDNMALNQVIASNGD